MEFKTEKKPIKIEKEDDFVKVVGGDFLQQKVSGFIRELKKIMIAEAAKSDLFGVNEDELIKELKNIASSLDKASNLIDIASNAVAIVENGASHVKLEEAWNKLQKANVEIAEAGTPILRLLKILPKNTKK